MVRSGIALPQRLQFMSAKGYCYDNSFAESCFAPLKHEMLPDCGRFESHQQAHRAIFDLIESFTPP